MQPRYYILGKRLLLSALRQTEADLLLGKATPADYKNRQMDLCDWCEKNEPAEVREESFA